jgi:hypothetical protein
MTAFGILLLESHREVPSWQEGWRGLALAFGVVYIF